MKLAELLRGGPFRFEPATIYRALKTALKRDGGVTADTLSKLLKISSDRACMLMAILNTAGYLGLPKSSRTGFHDRLWPLTEAGMALVQGYPPSGLTGVEHLQIIIRAIRRAHQIWSDTSLTFRITEMWARPDHVTEAAPVSQLLISCSVRPRPEFMKCLDDREWWDQRSFAKGHRPIIQDPWTDWPAKEPMRQLRRGIKGAWIVGNGQCPIGGINPVLIFENGEPTEIGLRAFQMLGVAWSKRQPMRSKLDTPTAVVS